jgi:tRNA A-37 threonylcarbamoyl transferase component Bud32
MPRKSDIRLGQLLVQRQWCSLTQVTAALDNQTMFRSRRQIKPLGRILIAEGHLSEDRLISALAEIGALYMHCDKCKWAGEIVELSEGKPGPCRECGDPLSLSDFRKRPAAKKAPASKSLDSLLSGDSSVSDLPTIVAHFEEISESSRVAESQDFGSAGAEEDSSDPLVGRILGGCQLTEKIARGGMGLIYKARQLNLKRVVAVKILAEDLSSDRSFVERFLEEARSAAQMNHHNIVHINDVGEIDGLFFFIMEFVDGENLKSVLERKGVLSVERSLAIALQVCSALRHSHGQGIIHRDVKPENIMITTDGVVKVADLGLAKRIEAANDGLTKAGTIFGTPYYMAPEQAKNFSDVDQRSDIYSLGVTLYKMITGKVPFDGRSPIEIMVKAFDGKHLSVRSLREDVPEEIERIVDRMMARQPQDRYQTVDAVLEEIKELLGSLSNRRRMAKLLSFS